MSSYTRKTRHPNTGKWQMANWLDNYFGQYKYGVLFPNDPFVYDAEVYELKTRANGINAKRKGNIGQSEFANYLKSHGFTAMSDGSRSGGGIFKGDVHNDQDICYEVKTCKKINLKECWTQVNNDSSKSHAMPVLAVHFDGMPKDFWLMVMGSDDWIAHMKGENQKDQSYTDPKFKWALQALKETINRVIKFLP